MDHESEIASTYSTIKLVNDHGQSTLESILILYNILDVRIDQSLKWIVLFEELLYFQVFIFSIRIGTVKQDNITLLQQTINSISTRL